MDVGTKLFVLEESNPYFWPEETVLAPRVLAQCVCVCACVFGTICMPFSFTRHHCIRCIITYEYFCLSPALHFVKDSSLESRSENPCKHPEGDTLSATAGLVTL